MRNRIYLIVALALILTINLASASMIFKYGDSDSTIITKIITNVSNSTEYWGNLHTPADIEHNTLALKQGGQVGEYYHGTLAQTYFWYNQSAGFYSWLSTFVYNPAYNYNMTTATGIYNYNQTVYGIYNYNQTMTFLYDYNQSNSIWHYNMTILSPYSYNQTLGLIYNYNQTQTSIYNYNQSDSIWHYNQTVYGIYNYNQTSASTYNITYQTFSFNQSISFYTWLSNFTYNYNMTPTSSGTGVASFVGLTSGTYNGNLSSGALKGYSAANDLCDGDYPGSHLCEYSEIKNSINQGISLGATTFWFSNGPPGFTAAMDDCIGYTSPSSIQLGAFWDPTFTNDYGAGFATNCANTKNLGCCQ